jgi:hypothetical protein
MPTEIVELQEFSVDKKCLNCKKQFKAKDNRSKYCSWECKEAHRFEGNHKRYRYGKRLAYSLYTPEERAEADRFWRQRAQNSAKRLAKKYGAPVGARPPVAFHKASY